jgi:protein-tyrosine phosphatase
MQLITAGNVPWLGVFQNKKTFLLEFPRTEVPFGSDNLVNWLLSKDCLPIIVHPERNSTFLKNRDKLQTFIDLGCPLQITASSLTGKFGSDVQKMSEELLEADEVSAIASDCHNLKGRSPDLLTGVEYAKRLLGDKAINLVNSTPKNLIHKNKFE